MVKVVVTIVLTLVLFFLIPVNSSLALSSVPPPTCKPPPVVNTPSSILAPGRTTGTTKHTLGFMSESTTKPV